MKRYWIPYIGMILACAEYIPAWRRHNKSLSWEDFETLGTAFEHVTYGFIATIVFNVFGSIVALTILWIV